MLSKIIYYTTVLGTTVFAEALLWRMVKAPDDARPGWFLATAAVAIIIVSGFMLLELIKPRTDSK